MFRFAAKYIAAASTAVFCAVSPAFGETDILLPQDMMVQIGQSANLCAVTFDDGPGPHTLKLLEILKKHNIKATFFLVGYHVKKYPYTVRRIAAAGHEIGNHSLDHKRLRFLPSDEQHKQIKGLQNMLADLGIECRVLRPPYGEYNTQTVAEAKKLGLDIVLWTVDSEDWIHPPTVDSLVSPTGRNRPSTGIFLFHDVHDTTIDSISDIIAYLKKSGCNFVTASEYLGNPAPRLRPLPPKRKAHEPNVQSQNASPQSGQPRSRI